MVSVTGIIAIQTVDGLPYFDIMSFAFDPDTVIVIGNVTDGRKTADGTDTVVTYDIHVETYLKTNVAKDVIHTFSQPTPDRSRGGNNYSYFDVGDRVILVLHPPHDKNQIKKHPDTYHINSLVNPHSVDQQLSNIWSVKQQVEYLLVREPENVSDGYYKTRHSEIMCNVGLKPIYKPDDAFASCVNANTHSTLLQRGWFDTSQITTNDLDFDYSVSLATNNTQYSLGDDVQMTVKNTGTIPVQMKGGFGNLSLRNISADEFVQMWYSADTDLWDEKGIRNLLMPDEERTLERNLWDGSKIQPGTYEISFTYAIMNKGSPVDVTSTAQFDVLVS